MDMLVYDEKWILKENSKHIEGNSVFSNATLLNYRYDKISLSFLLMKEYSKSTF